MNTPFKSALLAVLALSASTWVLAETPAEQQAERFDNRQERQVDRIQNGVQSGELTAREAKHLGHQQKVTNRMERRAERDGKVTLREAKRLEHRQDRNSRAIARANHDRQDRQ